MIHGWYEQETKLPGGAQVKYFEMRAHNDLALCALLSIAQPKVRRFLNKEVYTRVGVISKGGELIP